jgi:hypothetical protein
MGWWGSDLLAGDPPMDSLGYLGDVIDDPNLYPLNFTDAEAATVRAKLEALGDSVLRHPILGKAEHLPVVAGAFLATGAVMSDTFKASAITAAQNDYYGGPDWNDGGVGRAATMADLIEKIKAHEPGSRVEIVHKGLFQTIEEGESSS